MSPAARRCRFRRSWLNVACAYAVAGEADKALDALERVFAEGTANLAWIEQDSDLDALRSHPRFAALQRRG